MRTKAVVSALLVISLVIACGSPAWAGCPGSNGDFATIDDGGALLASFLSSPAYGDLTALLDPANPAIQVRGDLAEVLVSRDGDRGLLVPVYVGESAVGNIAYDPGGRAIAQVRTADGVRLVYADEAGYSHAQYVSRPRATTSDAGALESDCMVYCQAFCTAYACEPYCAYLGYSGWICYILCAGGCNMLCWCYCYGCVCCGGLSLPPRAYSPMS
jgi:hypothetical protein